jgi:hypothetical protein
MAQEPQCPKCPRVLSYVKDPDAEVSSGGGDRIVVKLASSIYEGADHGRWRVYINGKIEPYRE